MEMKMMMLKEKKREGDRETEKLERKKEGERYRETGNTYALRERL